METRDWITLAAAGIAGIALVLGLYNTYRARVRDKVKLRVVPNQGFLDGNPQQRIAIQVLNLSVFPVTISHVGFALRGKEGNIFLSEGLTDGSSLPRRLEARESLMLLCPGDFMQHPHFGEIRCAFVSTACGISAKGTSGALAQMVRQVRSSKRSRR